MPSDFENILLTAHKKGMLEYFNQHPACFNEAVRLAIGNLYPFAWRAASVLCSAIDENDPRMRPYINDILNYLVDKHDGHARELVKVLYKMELNEDQGAKLLDYCFTIWEITGKQSSVRYAAFMFMLKMAKKHPELKPEIALFAQDQYTDSLTPSIRFSIKRQLKQLM